MGDKQQLSEIEQEMEETRQRLATTIDELTHRASPKTIASREVASVKGFFVDDNGVRTGNVLKVAGGVVGAVLVFALVRKLAR